MSGDSEAGVSNPSSKRNFTIDFFRIRSRCTQNLKTLQLNLFQKMYVQVQTPLRILLHPQYDRRRTVNDVALIQLRQPLAFTRNIRPACVPDYEPPARSTRWGPVTGARCYAIGWGETQSKYRLVWFLLEFIFFYL